MKNTLLAISLLLIVYNNSIAQDSNKIQVNPSVFYQDPIKLNRILSFVENYLKIHNDIRIVSDSNWVLPSVKKKWPFPDYEIWGIENSPRFKEPQFYKPSILIVRDISPNTILVKIAFLHGFENGNASLIMIYDLFLIETNGRFYIYPQTQILTKTWKRKIIGNVEFVYDSNHIFNEVLALKCDSSNNSISDFFDLPPLKFEFFVTNGANQIYQIKGVNFNQLMNSTNQYAGSADIMNYKIFSGNSSEYYPHEVVHLYTHKKFGKTFSFFDEGIATYLAGSRGLPLETHIRRLKNYLRDNSKINLNNLLAYNGAIDDTTNFDYATGGLMCKLIIEKVGKTRFLQIVDKISANPEIFYSEICTILNIKRDELHEFLTKAIQTY